ncbi:LTA synthase family protein [Paenibacillus marinisediminis]
MNGTFNHSLQGTNRRSPIYMVLTGLPFILFILTMLGKTVLLNKMLAIPNMATDFSDILVAVGALFIAAGWTWWLPKRWRPFALLLLNIVLTFMLFADLVYYRYFQDFITIPVLLQAFQVSALGDSIASLIQLSDILFFLDWIVIIPITIMFERAWKREYKHQKESMGFHYSRPSKLRRGLLRFTNGLLAIIIGSLLLAMPIQYATSTWAKGIFTGNWWNPSIYNITGLYGFHGYDIYRYAKENWFVDESLTEAEQAELEQWFGQHKEMLKGPASTFGKYKGKNVLVVQAEAFENFVIGKSVNGQEITPNLNALVQDSLYYKRFFHQTGQGRTSDADFGVQTSLHPLPTGSVFIRYPDHQYDALPSILKEAGYTTGAFHAYEASFWNRYVMYENLGYDYFMSKKDYVIDEPLGWSLGDTSFFRQSVERMANEQSPFYSFMITLSSHHPYKLPAEAQKLNVGEYQDTIFGDYLQSVHYVDHAMGELIQDLKQRGLWENTILVFYGDHDNSIGEKEPFEKLLGKPLSDFEFMEMQGQVPMIIHLPDGAEKGTVDTVTGQLDVAPTLLHWLGIDPTNYFFMGSNMQAEGEHLIVQRNGSVTNGELYYVPSADGIYENGTCYKYDTGEPGDLGSCRPMYDEALKRLNLSDLIIEKNAIHQMRQP